MTVAQELERLDAVPTELSDTDLEGVAAGKDGFYFGGPGWGGGWGGGGWGWGGWGGGWGWGRSWGWSRGWGWGW